MSANLGWCSKGRDTSGTLHNRRERQEGEHGTFGQALADLQSSPNRRPRLFRRECEPDGHERLLLE